MFKKAVMTVAAAGILVTLAGCGKGNRLSSFEDEDMRSAHPVMIKPVERSLIVLGSGRGGALDDAEADRVVEFARHYAKEGRGALKISLPVRSSQARSKATAASVPNDVSRALARGGAGGTRSVTRYAAPTDLAAPIKLSYMTIEAVVDRNCPSLPDRSFSNKQDPASGTLGCAYTSAIAGQVSRASDLVEPRAIPATDQTQRFPKRTN